VEEQPARIKNATKVSRGIECIPATLIDEAGALLGHLSEHREMTDGPPSSVAAFASRQRV
jgi:hypothetical protein